MLDKVAGVRGRSEGEATAELLSALRAREVKVWVEGDRLRLSAPRNALTSEMQAELTQRKGEIVAYLRAAGARDLPPLTKAPREEDLPLSFAQERMWFLQRMDPESVAYNLQANIPFAGALDLSALELALGSLVRRHEILRSTFAEAEGRPVQRVEAPVSPELARTDLTQLPEAERAPEAERLATLEVRRPFDLSTGPVVRLHLLRLDEQQHQLLVTQHHIVTDGWSIALLVEEVLALYRSFATGQIEPPSPPALQYADFARWQREWLRGEVLEGRLAYWRARLEGAPAALDLPTDRPRPAVQTFRGATLHFDLPEELSRSVRELGRAEGITPFMTLLAAFQVMLARYAGQEDVVTGTANGNRSLLETERMLGLFVNTLVLRTDVGGDPTFRELLARVRKVVLGAFEHGDLPFEKLVEELRPPRDLARSPLFQVLFVIQNTPLEALSRSSRGTPGVIGTRGTAAYELSLYIIDTGRGFRGSLEYNTDLFDEATVGRMRDHYRGLLGHAVTDPERRLSEICPVGEAERRHLLGEWNASEKAVPSEAIHQRFAAQAARTPDALAVTAGAESLTYGELERRANRLGRHLVDLGVRPGSLVALQLDRSVGLMVGLLGILKAGGAYVPLDPSYPRERIAAMLEDSQPTVVVTERQFAGDLPPSNAVFVLLDEGLPASDAPLPSAAEGEDLAYVIFTSGSTGRPKGVEVPHRALTNLLASMEEEPGLEATDVLLAVTTLAFDIAGLELFLPLVTGGRLVIASRDTAHDPAALRALLESSGATVMQATPATWRMLVEAGFSGKADLKALCGGEAMPADLAEALRVRCAELWNVYGPTETTIWSTVERVAEVGSSVSIGRPIANTRVYLLDPRLQLAPLGAAGELYIGGAGVARGYRGRPDLTAERFVPDPFSLEPGGRLYRTGDLARYRTDGRIECLGRVDHQVKLRGFRIELGEIEAALRAQGGVQDCVVVARGAGEEKRLLAYVVGEGTALREGDLRLALKSRLPDYMVPAAFVTLPALPRTPNGKLDRAALPEPAPGQREGALALPRGPIQEAVAEIWREVLGLDRVGVHESFFELGGHSLAATRVLARIQDALGVAVPLRKVFESPTIGGLADVIERAGHEGIAETAPLTPVPRDRELALSFGQERLWFLHQLEDASAAYHVPGALQLRGPLDVPALERSLAELWRRHESLRTTFDVVDGRPVQRITPSDRFNLERRDLAGLDPEERVAEARRQANEEARRPFDLETGPLFRCTLLRLGEEEHLLMITLHHVVADGWSLGILVSELSLLYRAFRRGEASPLPEPVLQFADFAQWQRRVLGAQESDLVYWRRQLAAVPALEFPTDRPRPPLQTFRGAQHHFAIDPGLAERVRRVARQEKATLFMVLLAAFQTLLKRYSGQDDIVVGTPIAGRPRAELENVVGLFANTLVLRTDLQGDPTFREALARVREVALDAYAHQETPFEKLVEELRPERNPSRSPLFQVMLVLQNAPAAALDLKDLSLRSYGVDSGTSRFELTLFVTETSQGLFVTAEYNCDLFDKDRIARLGNHLCNLLAAAVEAPDQRLSGLSILDEGERRTLLEQWNATARQVGTPAVHERIAAQAARTPEAAAVSFEGETLTYGALDRRANQLAHRLRSIGVGPERLVGIAVERSLDMVIALLGVLKAGGTYLPLDPSYPRERLAYMLEDARAHVLLTQEALRAGLPDTKALVLCVDSADLDGESTEDPGVRVEGDELAYLIYTSGSTGRPKGVQIPHRALSNFLEAMAEEPGLEPRDVLLSVTTLSFDIAGLEIYLPLVQGAKLEIVSRETATDGVRLAEQIARSGATVMQATPATWRLLVEAGWKATGMKALCGGEALPAGLAEEILRRAGSLFNLYGPTETTIWSAVHPVAWAEAVAPLGRPIGNTQLFVLDAQMGPVPLGVPGELYIGGAGLARGYRNRPDLTADRFLPNPFGRDGERLYRTGDLVRWRSDGVLEFLGRADHQVKVRGFRIELGEIEGQLLALPGVKSAVVLPRQDGVDGVRLGAYVVLAAGFESTVTELRAALRDLLPGYMVPSAFVILDDLPLTPNGKMDRSALARLDGSESARAEHLDPRTPMEKLVGGIWMEALGTPRVSVRDNFFDLGGHSLLSMRVLARVEKAIGRRLNPRDLIFQTLEQFAAMCERREATAPGGSV